MKRESEALGPFRLKPATTDKNGLLKIEEQLCFALYSTSRAITQEYAVLLEAMGVTYPQYLALPAVSCIDGTLAA